MNDNGRSTQQSSGAAIRVCVVSGESRRGIGGLAAYNRLLTRHLRAAGVTVTSVARFDRPIPGELNYAASTGGDGDVVDDLATRLLRPAAWARPALRELNHLVGRPAGRGIAKSIFNAGYGPSVRRAIDRGTDVVHYIGTGWELLGFAALRRARQIGAAFTCWPAVHVGSWGDSPLDVDLYNRCDAVFCQSDHEKEHLALRGVRPERLVRAMLAPAVEAAGDGERFRARYALGRRPIVLFIARKLRSKGFHALCEAMPIVRRSIPDALLVALGPEGEPPYPPLPADAYLDVGEADELTKADALAASDVFAMPSAAESFGIVYVEAWSYGKPAVGGPARAVGEMFDRTGAGLFLGSQGAAGIASAVASLLSDRDLRDRMGTAGRRHVEDHYNWPTVTNLHLDVFRARLRSRLLPPSAPALGTADQQTA